MFKDSRTSLHVDNNNAVGFPNNAVKVSSFDNGGLWFQDEQGLVPCLAEEGVGLLGICVDYFTDEVISFDARKKPCTLPWSGGSRVVLVGFVVKGPELISPEMRTELAAAGFHVRGTLTDNEPPFYVKNPC